MQYLISYFYQIRFMKPNMIPISTCMYDPKWYHEFKGQSHYYFDKNGVINGLRYPLLNPNIECKCPCPNHKKTTSECNFIQDYYNAISKINFDEMISKFNKIADWLKLKLNLVEDMQIVLIVHETPQNPCSERSSLIKLFSTHGIELKEFENA